MNIISKRYRETATALAFQRYNETYNLWRYMSSGYSIRYLAFVILLRNLIKIFNEYDIINNQWYKKNLRICLI